MSGEELPEGWAVALVQDVGEVRLGKQRSPKDHTGDRMREYLRVANVFDSRLDLSDVMSMNFTADEEATFALKQEDILLNEGQSPNLLGRPAMYDAPDGRYAFTNSLIRFRARSGVIPQFMLQQFRHMMFSGQFAAVAQITTNIAHLGKDRFANLRVGVPPTAEQERVSARLRALQARSRAAREALAEVPALLDTFRQSVLAAAFRGDLTAEWRAKNPDVEPASKLLKRIRAERKQRWEQANPKKKYVEPEPVDDSELPELPYGWCWAKLEELVASISYGYTASASTDRTGRAFLRITDLTDAGVNWDTVPYCPPPADPRYDLKTGDIVVARTGATTGKSYRLSDPPPGAVFASYLIRLEALDGCPSEYVAGFMKGPSYWAQITTLAKGTAQPGANATVLGGVVVPLCPRQEMPRIIDAANTVLAGVERLARAESSMAADLDALDQAILARAFRGELVEQDPNDEPAEALLARIRSDGESAPVRTRAKGSGG